jgi:hypothetical protein
MSLLDVRRNTYANGALQVRASEITVFLESVLGRPVENHTKNADGLMKVLENGEETPSRQWKLSLFLPLN